MHALPCGTHTASSPACVHAAQARQLAGGATLTKTDEPANCPRAGGSLVNDKPACPLVTVRSHATRRPRAPTRACGAQPRAPPGKGRLWWVDAWREREPAGGRLAPLVHLRQLIPRPRPHCKQAVSGSRIFGYGRVLRPDSCVIFLLLYPCDDFSPLMPQFFKRNPTTP